MSKFPEYTARKITGMVQQGTGMLFRPVCTATSVRQRVLFLPDHQMAVDVSTTLRVHTFGTLTAIEYLDFMCAYGPNVLGYCGR